jgi:Anti-sigma factor NepR
MNGPKFDEAEKLRREAFIRMGDGLRDHYDDVLKEDMPNRLTGLLRRLLAPNEAGWKEQ